MSVENGFSPENQPREVEPQLPIIRHRIIFKFDAKRSEWPALLEDEKWDLVDEARLEVEDQNKWWRDRPAKAHSNVYSWTQAVSLSAALVIRESGEVDLADRYLRRARDNFYQQVKDNVYEDGSSLDFHDRDSIHYHVFNEVAWLKSANYLKEIGEVLPPDVTEKLERSIDFVEPFIKGEKEHLEFVNSSNPRDALRHPDRLGKPFNPESTSYVKILEAEITKFRGSSL